MKKYIFGILIILIIAVLAVSVAIYGSKKSDNDKNIEFLKGYGWEVDENPIEQCEIKIPERFDDVYENYNFLQKEAGLDLTPYSGCEGIRYTYILKNFPYTISEQVRANVITIDHKPVAGDIMVVSVNGFMYSLNFNEKVCIALK